MAWYYYLLAAFDQQASADACAALFRESQFALAAGRTFHCNVDVWSTINATYWVYCEPQGVSLGTHTPPWTEAAAQLDEVAALLYRTLIDVNDFICAMVGWEVAELFLPDATAGYTEIRIEPREFLEAGWSGLVITDTLWHALEKPAIFQPFSPGYVWQPYRRLSISGW